MPQANAYSSIKRADNFATTRLDRRMSGARSKMPLRSI